MRFSSLFRIVVAIWNVWILVKRIIISIEKKQKDKTNVRYNVGYLCYIICFRWSPFKMNWFWVSNEQSVWGIWPCICIYRSNEHICAWNEWMNWEQRTYILSKPPCYYYFGVFSSVLNLNIYSAQMHTRTPHTQSYVIINIGQQQNRHTTQIYSVECAECTVVICVSKLLPAEPDCDIIRCSTSTTWFM